MFQITFWRGPITERGQRRVPIVISGHRPPLQQLLFGLILIRLHVSWMPFREFAEAVDAGELFCWNNIG
jgi:hypothetical protein